MAEQPREGGPAERPTHPGAILRDVILPDLKKQGVTVEALARALGMSRQNLHAILAERQGVTSETAVRLGACFGNRSKFWLDLQSAHDLWEAERSIDVSTIPRLGDAA
jgi:addiction module HigA family antidote